MAHLRDESFTICTWDVDQADKLTMSSAFNFCQEVAGNHARTLGVGAEVLRDKGFAWVLSRMSLALEERPGWGTRIIARTWPRGRDRLFALRDYQLMTPDERIFARGRSAWILLNTTTLRPQRVEALGVDIPDNPGMDALLDGVKSVEGRDDCAVRGERRAGYSDIDYNGHVNNARYVQWIQDILPIQPLLNAASLRLDINYLAEVKPDERASLSMVEFGSGGPSGFYVEGALGDGGTPCFRAQFSLSAAL
jgi:medium-chain acyl-[acyl-carrier-protein] hydrolase